MSSQRPDILFIVLDTQRADRLSCYGYPLDTTPNLDAFAANATRFETAIAPAQWTIPSHASMFTGVYPSEHGMTQSYSVMPDELPTLAERLRDSGYFTAGFCNNPLVGVINNGLRRGFQSFLNYSGLLTSRPNQAGVSPGLVGRYRQWFKRQVSGVMTKLQDAFARSDWLLALSFTPIMVPLWQTALSFKGNTAKSLEDTARLLCDRVGTEPDQPIFAFVNLMGTHMPYHPPRQYIETYAPHVLRDRDARSFLQRFNNDVYGWLAPLTGALNDDQKKTLDGMYDAEVAYQDALLGDFFAKLEQARRLEHTLVVICADHGEHLGEKQLMGHSLSIYNELVRVPLIIRQPGQDETQATVVPEVVSTRRLFQTVLDAAELANNHEQPLTLLPQPQADPETDFVFAEAIPPQNVVNLMQKRQPDLVRDRACDQPRRAVWMGTHKLIEIGDREIELYDVQEDPQETLNISAILPENVEALQECLQSFAGEMDGYGTLVTARRAPGYDDPDVQRRLQDLGYLED
ncbi:sulfatase [Leptolyngbya iicbica]|uniref:Sulfatase n=2 Tax=Cyanophyceae TaxID=3028117 RepID=A0A4Q7E9W0_9CYAN|nr:sulfatase [Leptolyngbya sp. LK]RZM79667.1 sulfatase [Leptolyngbya sp. LK]